MQKDKRQYNILVVEDNPGDSFLIKDFLEEMILSPAIVRLQQFNEVEEFLSSQFRQVDVILLDLNLVDKGGKDIIKDIMNIAGHIPVIVLTNYTDYSFAIKSLSIGVSDYLLKDDLNATTLYKSILYNKERNKILQTLKNSEQRYADLFQLNPQPMWVYDIETLNFLDVNEAAINSYGYTREEFMGMTIRNIRPGEEIPLLETQLNIHRNYERFFFRGVFNHIKKSGEVMKVEIRSNTVWYQGKKAEVILANDITERLNNIKGIEIQNEKLKEIAWTMSHVVRAPVSRIMALIHLISHESYTIDLKMEMLPHLLESANELDTIIKDVINKTQQI